MRAAARRCIVVALPARAAAGRLGSLRDLGGLDGCLSSGGAADCRPSQSTRGVIEMAFTADGQYAYATSFYDGRVQALKRNATTGKLDADQRAAVGRQRRTASPSRPTASRSTPPTAAGVVTFNRDQATGAITQAGFTDGGLKHPRLATLRDGHRHQPRRQVRLRRASARSTRSSSSPATLATGALTRVPGPAGLRERARAPGRRRSGHGGRVRRGAGDARHHRHHGRPGRHAALHRVRPARLDRRPHPQRDHGHARAAGGRRAVRGAGRQAGAWPDDSNPLLNEKVFDCKAGQPALGVPQRHLVLARRRQRLRRRPARHGRLHAQRRDRRADA